MLGSFPKRVHPPNISNAKVITLPNNPKLFIQICSYPAGEYLVETVIEKEKAYQVVIKKPNGKLDPSSTSDQKKKKRIEKILQELRNVGCDYPEDFTVWVFESQNIKWMPKHLQTLEAFSKLCPQDKKKVFGAIKSVILDYLEPENAMRKNLVNNEITLNSYPLKLVLKYLKWMATLEDILYPPICDYLGRKMAFAGYVLVNEGLYSPSEIRRLLRIW